MNIEKKGFNVTFYLLIIPVLLWLFILIVLPHMDLFVSSFQVEADDGDTFVPYGATEFTLGLW